MKKIFDNGFYQDFNDNGYFAGKLLVSMPFNDNLNKLLHSVIYLCSHDSNGAIGLMINQPLTSLTFDELLYQLNISNPKNLNNVELYVGGPVEVSRGFVLHSPDYISESTIKVGKNLRLTATLDILKSLANGTGPRDFLISLGYMQWTPNQLEQEINDNAWMIVEADENIIFNHNIHLKWKMSMSAIGINDISFLSMQSGKA